MSDMGRAGKHRGTIIGVAIVAIVVIVACAFALHSQGGDGHPLSIVVHDGDGGERTLPLDEDASMTVETSFGTNTIIVEDGAARVSEADCPNHDCMRQRPISHPGQQLICLPHELWVEVVATDEDGADGLDVDAVDWGDAEAGDDVAVDTVAR